MKVYDSEMVTLRGAVFGRIWVNTICISFKSEERRGDFSKYKYGSTEHNRLENEKINKRWKLEEITEIVLKRYNLLRQSCEIYFKNSKSIYISLFRRRYLQQFMSDLKYYRTKNPNLHYEIIVNPEKYFADRKFKEAWVSGHLTNFEYLMLLNKYSGRSFNDLSQYPVFPWAIQDYTSENINLGNINTYRQFDKTIAGMTPDKRKRAEEKELILSNEGEKPYQFGTHYLPGRIVLGYMLRLEPYASLLVKFEKGHDAAARMFHVLKDAWDSGLRDPADNKELIPEFFYLPDIFANYNQYAFGTKIQESETEIKYVRVDQVVLPTWAKTAHIFVKNNALALESRLASLALDKWIDLIFGENQQESKFYNVFKPFCDEETIASMKIKPNESQLTEIQEFGMNPIKLFREKHPQRTDQSVRMKIQYAIFDAVFDQKAERLFALLKVHTFSEKNAVCFIDAYDKKVISILNTQKLYKTKEGYINVPHEKSIIFDKREINLFPYKTLYSEGSKTFNNCDAQRCFITFDNGNYVMTCRHYDNTVKFININTGEIEKTLSFHKSTVNAICSTFDKKKIFTGSNNGVLAMWNYPKKDKNFSPVWYVCDHKMPIISLDANEKIDLIITGGLDGAISIRTITTGKFVRIIYPNLLIKNTQYEISHVRISFRGYIVILARAKNLRSIEGDYKLIYSINGELIYAEQTKDVINSIVMAENGYEFITGGNTGRLLKHNIVNPGTVSILESLDPHQLGVELTLNELLASDTAITALGLTKQEGCQQLLIGLSTGAFYTYKFSPRLIGSKIFDSLQGLI